MIDLALDSRVFLNNDLDCALQEIDILFNTQNTEVLGFPEYGSEFEKYLWTLTPAVNSLQEYVYNLIGNYTFFAKKFNPKVNVQFLQGEYRNIYYVQISLTTPMGEIKTKNYRFQ